MHELSVSSAIVATAVQAAEGRKVTSVQVRLGHLRQVVPKSLLFYWEIVTRETLCEGSRLDQEIIPATLRCDDCSHEWTVDMPFFRCPECESSDTTVLTGEELEIESIEVEETNECTV